MQKTILVLGGGIGGLVAANELAHKVGRAHKIKLVDRSPKHVFSASLPWVMAGLRRPEQVSKDLRRMIRSEVEIVQSEVKAVDPDKQIVKTEAGDISYDYLIIALGAELAPASLPGFSEAAHEYFTVEGATKLTKVLKEFPGGKVAVLVTKLPYKCPAAPYEGALMIRDVFRRRGFLEKIDIQVYTPEVLPMPVAGPVLGQAVKGMLENVKIGFHPGLQLESINSNGHELSFKDGSKASYDLLVGVPPHRAPRALEGSPLVNEAGWIPVNRQTLSTKFGNIYAIGDVTAVALPNGKALPKAGVFAHFEAQVVARRIAADILGTNPEDIFNGLGYCWIEMGNGMAGFASGNFYAEPDPSVELRRPGRLWHWGKVQFENYWLGDSIGKMTAQWTLKLGGKFLNIPGSL